MASWRAPLPTQKTPDVNPILETTSRKGREWFEQCNQHHGKCSLARRAFAPKRLVDVGPPDGSVDPVLVETAGILPGKYSGLSDQSLSCNAKEWLTQDALGDTQHSVTAGDTLNI